MYFNVVEIQVQLREIERRHTDGQTNRIQNTLKHISAMLESVNKHFSFRQFSLRCNITHTNG